MTRGRLTAAALAALLLCAPGARGQDAPPSRAQEPEDALGRDTPRGTLLGFMAAASKGNFEAAGQYVSTPRDLDVQTIAHQLYVVLDTRLPARLRELMDSLLD